MVLIATGAPEDTDALRALRELAVALGFAHVLYLLAEVADEQRDAAAEKNDAEHANRARHDARVYWARRRHRSLVEQTYNGHHD